MGIIKEVMIENYKGLENIEFASTSINVIVGPNNTGKSSILESIWMVISSLNNFKDTLNTELDEVIKDIHKNSKYLIHQGELKSKIKLKFFEDEAITLDLSYFEKDYPQEIADYFLDFLDDISKSGGGFEYPFSNSNKFYLDLRRLLFRLRKPGGSKEEIDELAEKISKTLDSASDRFKNELIKSEKLFLTSKINGNFIAIYTIVESLDHDIPIPEEILPDFRKIPLIISSQCVSGKDITELHKKLVDTKKLKHVIEILTERIPYFQDIREVDGELYVWLTNTKYALPLSFMGDGFKTLLKLSFIAPLIKNGIVLFEEPEITMHPGYFDILAEEILSYSENSQFFITTHSQELLEYLLEKASEKNKLDSINIIRMTRNVDGYISREVLRGREAKEEREKIKIDLRGY